jgi:predicted nuclease of predicted toxin-antitoxin system
LTKILADENIPIEAVKLLQSKGVDIVYVTEFSQGLSDLEVLELANRENRAILTFDKDFGEMVVREKAKVKGLILLRFAPRTPEQIAARVWQILTSQFPVENSLLVVRENTIRIIRLKPPEK